MKATDIFNIKNDAQFNALALDIFRFQYENNQVYREFVDYLTINSEKIDNYQDIPFLPIDFFKNKRVVSDDKGIEDVVFTSSGTSGMQQSKHYVKDLTIYEESFFKGFEHFFGNTKDYAVLALLPSYLEREGSSLIYMVTRLIEASNNLNSAFYLYNFAELYNKLNTLKEQKQKTVLFGVSFALLDFVSQYSIDFKELIIIETGGMKGRKKEIVREELHQIIKSGFNSNAICSEYGMTELLSQAYALNGSIFQSPPWMKILIRDINDPLSLIACNKTGGINIIDLANFNSCSFIATQDLGKTYDNGTFEVIGRFDHSDTRGCNLLVV